MRGSYRQPSDLERLERRLLLSSGTLTFQQGVGGYAGTQDTYVQMNNAGASFGSQTSARVEAQDGQHTQSLIRFDDLFGSLATQVPAGATITSAMLTVYTGNSMGDEATTSSSLYRMLVGWSESSTWNSMGGGINADGTEALPTPDGTITPSTLNTPMSFNVTSTVQAWANVPSGNHGWTLIGNGTNLWKWITSEKTDATRRPELTISYETDGGPGPVNQAPLVSAGNDAAVTMPNAAALNGTVSDDGLPAGPANITSVWSKVSGPGQVSFANAGLIDTTATFSEAGMYVLRLTASDGELSASDDVTIVVNPATPPPPPPADETTVIDSLQISTDTGEKPQSKVWENRGKWWGVFAKSDGSWVWRLDGDTWTPVLKLNTAKTARADVKVVGDVAHVLLYNGTTSKLASIEYTTASGVGTYKLWSVRPTLVNVPFVSGVEVGTIDIDGDGRMLAVGDSTSSIQARYANYPYGSWSSPITLASNVKGDDISAIKTMPDGSIGVLWSNQNAKRFGFRRHLPGTPPTSWTADEVPASQSALNVGLGMADDHLSLAVHSDGTLYAAVKTSYDSDGHPAIALLVRRPNGMWDDLYTVDTTGTRGIVALNEADDSLMVAYSFTGGNGSGDIVYKKTSLSNISFASPRTTIMRGSLNNVSTAKDPTTDDVVFVAANTSKVLHGVRMAWPGSSTSMTLVGGFRTSGSSITFDDDSTTDESLLDGLVSL